MAFNKVTQYVSETNFLESEVGLVLKTATGEQTKAVLDTATNKKLIQGGSIYPANDATAKGIVFETVDMTDDAKRPISLMVAGRVLEKRLAVEVNTNAKTALEKSGIVFVTTEDPVF